MRKSGTVGEEHLTNGFVWITVTHGDRVDGMVPKIYLSASNLRSNRCTYTDIGWHTKF